MKSLSRFVIGAAVAAWTAYALGEKAISAFAPAARAAVAGEVPARAEPVVPAPERVEEPLPSRKASERIDDLVTEAGTLAGTGWVQAIAAILAATIVSLVVGYKSRPTVDRRRENREIRKAQWRQQQRERDLRLLATAASRGNPAPPVGNGTQGSGKRQS